MIDEIFEEVKDYAKDYIKALSHNRYAVREFIGNAVWVVLQKASDYNPVHFLRGTLSEVIYLQVPEEVSKQNNKNGKITFIHGQESPQSLMFHGHRTITPKAGDIYLFPSWMNHTIYPFFDDQE